jgi:hypothetical protein
MLHSFPFGGTGIFPTAFCQNQLSAGQVNHNSLFVTACNTPRTTWQLSAKVTLSICFQEQKGPASRAFVADLLPGISWLGAAEMRELRCVRHPHSTLPRRHIH